MTLTDTMKKEFEEFKKTYEILEKVGWIEEGAVSQNVNWDEILSFLEQKVEEANSAWYLAIAHLDFAGRDKILKTRDEVIMRLEAARQSEKDDGHTPS